MLADAVRRIKRGISPKPLKIDYQEPWTLKDIYDLHPRGHTIELWYGLTDVITSRRIESENKRGYARSISE